MKRTVLYYHCAIDHSAIRVTSFHKSGGGSRGDAWHLHTNNIWKDEGGDACDSICQTHNMPKCAAATGYLTNNPHWNIGFISR